MKSQNTQYDAIVIGSGIGGLSVASILAKSGKSVLVLERHYMIGGYTHAFQRKGFSWDVGLHYVGDVHIPGTMINKVFRYITNEQLQWKALDAHYDRAVFGNEEFAFIQGREPLKKSLKAYFPDPESHASIDAYFQLLEKASRAGMSFFIGKILPPFLSSTIGHFLRKNVLRYSDKTTLETLRSITNNEKLIGILTAQYGDYGLPPNTSSFFMHAMLANHYMEGAGYPIGGASNLAKTIVPVIEEHGGTVRINAEVKEVIIKNNTAIGVELINGEKIYATNIISDAGIYNSFSKLLPTKTQKEHQLKDKLKNLEPSAAHVGLYLGLKGSTKELHLPACNYWIFPAEYNHELNQKRYKNFDSELPVTYLSFPSAKDPEWQKNHPEKSLAEAVIIIPYAWFTEWEKTSWKKRGADYEQLKQRLADQMLEVIYRVKPEIKGKIEYMEVSTPLTTKQFSNHQHGEIYGAAFTPKRFRQPFLTPRTPVKNFYLTGQDASATGITGSTMGGVLCATVILKKNVFSLIERSIK